MTDFQRISKELRKGKIVIFQDGWGVFRLAQPNGKAYVLSSTYLDGNAVYPSAMSERNLKQLLSNLSLVYMLHFQGSL